MELMSKMLSKMAAYQKCLDKKCKLESNAHKKASETFKNQLHTRRAEFLSKKISLEKFRSESQKITHANLNLEESKKKNECAIKKCKNELVDFLEFLAENTKADCKKNKLPKVCDISQHLERYKNLVKADKMTHEDMKELVMTFMNMGTP
jgi:hypothetical protein